MSIAELNIVDAIGVDKKENALRMMISDHLDWEDKDVHLEILQEKILNLFKGVSKEQISQLNDVINIIKLNIEEYKGERQC